MRFSGIKFACYTVQQQAQEQQQLQNNLFPSDMDPVSISLRKLNSITEFLATIWTLVKQKYVILFVSLPISWDCSTYCVFAATFFYEVLGVEHMLEMMN